jgi:hypothetical protein
MAIKTADVEPDAPYTVHLSFVGIATYTLTEYAEDAGGWRVSNRIQKDGHSTDPQHDTYDLTPVPRGIKRLVVAEANMSSATGDGDLSLVARFGQAGRTFFEDRETGKDDGNLPVLRSRVVMTGVVK